MDLIVRVAYLNWLLCGCDRNDALAFEGVLLHSHCLVATGELIVSAAPLREPSPGSSRQQSIIRG